MENENKKLPKCHHVAVSLDIRHGKTCDEFSLVCKDCGAFSGWHPTQRDAEDALETIYRPAPLSPNDPAGNSELVVCQHTVGGRIEGKRAEGGATAYRFRCDYCREAGPWKESPEESFNALRHTNALVDLTERRRAYNCLDLIERDAPEMAAAIKRVTYDKLQAAQVSMIVCAALHEVQQLLDVTPEELAKRLDERRAEREEAEAAEQTASLVGADDDETEARK